MLNRSMTKRWKSSKPVIHIHNFNSMQYRKNVILLAYLFLLFEKSWHINPWFSIFALFCYEPVQHFFALLLYSIVYSARWVSICLNLCSELSNQFIVLDNGFRSYASYTWDFQEKTICHRFHKASNFLLRVSDLRIQLSSPIFCPSQEFCKKMFKGKRGGIERENREYCQKYA